MHQDQNCSNHALSGKKKILFVAANILLFLHVCHMEDMKERVATVDHIEDENEWWPVRTI